MKVEEPERGMFKDVFEEYSLGRMLDTEWPVRGPLEPLSIREARDGSGQGGVTLKNEQGLVTGWIPWNKGE